MSARTLVARSLREAFETVLVEEVIPAYLGEDAMIRGVLE